MKLTWTKLATSTVWPEWTIIDNFPFKSSPNILVKFWALLKTSFFNWCGYFFATFGNLLASFISTSGHTESNDRSSKINADGIEHKSLIPKNFSNQLLKNLLDLLNQNKKYKSKQITKKLWSKICLLTSHFQYLTVLLNWVIKSVSLF